VTVSQTTIVDVAIWMCLGLFANVDCAGQCIDNDLWFPRAGCS
jgi:hypothetical protein